MERIASIDYQEKIMQDVYYVENKELEGIIISKEMAEELLSKEAICYGKINKIFNTNTMNLYYDYEEDWAILALENRIIKNYIANKGDEENDLIHKSAGIDNVIENIIKIKYPEYYVINYVDKEQAFNIPTIELTIKGGLITNCKSNKDVRLIIEDQDIIEENGQHNKSIMIVLGDKSKSNIKNNRERKYNIMERD